MARPTWAEVAAWVAVGPDCLSCPAEVIHSVWTEYGHKIRDEVKDDYRLVNFLRLNLPSYSGPGLTLYRGENAERFSLGKVGLCWTDNVKTAKMFAQGLNSIKSGGVLLVVEAPPEAILSGPSEHSRWLDEEEYTVDVSMLPLVKAVEWYAPVT